MDPKPRPNDREYIAVLRRMTPHQRLRRAFELSDLTWRLFLHGLRRRFPEASEEEIRKLAAKRLFECSNNNY